MASFLPRFSASENHAHPGDDEHAPRGNARRHLLPDPRGRPARQLSLGTQRKTADRHWVRSLINVFNILLQFKKYFKKIYKFTF